MAADGVKQSWNWRCKRAENNIYFVQIHDKQGTVNYGDKIIVYST